MVYNEKLLLEEERIKSFQDTKSAMQEKSVLDMCYVQEGVLYKYGMVCRFGFFACEGCCIQSVMWGCKEDA